MIRRGFRSLSKALWKIRRKAAYKSFMRSPEWDAIRRAALERAHYKCRRCGLGDRVLQVHHKNYTRFGGNELSIDLEVLCVPCHKIADWERKRAKKRR